MPKTNLTRMKLINWYGFRNETIPFDEFKTHITGKNQSGKSTLIDAFRYGAHGDTQFNISASAKETGDKTRTISTYTRCLENDESGYLRPADKFPYVHTHIAIEYHDTVDNRYFVLDTMITTDPKDTIVTLRYSFDHTRLEDITFFGTMEDGKKYLLSQEEFSEANGKTRGMLKKEGLDKFFTMTGLRLPEGEITNYARSFRSLVAYNPKSKIRDYIKSSVLRDQKVNIGKLKESKNKLFEVGEKLAEVNRECDALKEIGNDYRSYEMVTERLLRAQIKKTYAGYVDKKRHYEEAAKKEALSEQKKKETEEKTKELINKKTIADQSLINAMTSMSNYNNATTTKEILLEQKKADHKRAEEKYDSAKVLEEKLHSISEKLTFLSEEESSLLEKVIRSEHQDKEESLYNIINKLSEEKSKTTEKWSDKRQKQKETIKEITSVSKQLTNIKNRSFIPENANEYRALRDEINAYLKSQGLPEEAKMAFEYVEEITDESWRPVIENMLGDSRFSILVPEKLYDAACSVQENTRFKRAKLVRIKKVLSLRHEKGENNLSDILKVTNRIARKYFDLLLDYRMTETTDVKNHDYAVSKTGFQSGNLWTGYVDMKRAKGYCLGFNALQIMEKAMTERLSELDKEDLLLRKEIDELNQLTNACNDASDLIKRILDNHILDAKEQLVSAKRALDREQKEYNELREMLNKDPNFIKLNNLIEKAKKQCEYLELVIKESDQNIKIYEKEHYETGMEKKNLETILYGADKKHGIKEELERHKKEHPEIFKRAKEEYDRYLVTGNQNLNVVSDETFRRYHMDVNNTLVALKDRQLAYTHLFMSGSKPLGIGAEYINSYRERYNILNVKNREEAINKYEITKKECNSIFKNEFIGEIRKLVDEAMTEKNRMNRDLRSLNYSTRYEFIFKEIDDGSKFSKILKYGTQLKDIGFQLLENNEQNIISSNFWENNEPDISEKEMDEIINDIIYSDDFEPYEDYRNYMTYDIRLTGPDYPGGALLTKQVGYNSGAGTQIPYTIILISALTRLYNNRTNSTRLIIFDEAFEKLDEANVSSMIRFIEDMGLQAIYVAGNKMHDIGQECNMIVPVVTKQKDDMRIGHIEFKEDF